MRVEGFTSQRVSAQVDRFRSLPWHISRDEEASLTVNELFDILDAVEMTRGIEQDTAVLVLGEVRDLPRGIGNVVGAALGEVLDKLRESLETMEDTIDSLGLEDSLAAGGDRQSVALVCVHVEVIVRGLNVNDDRAQGGGGLVVGGGPVVGDHGIVLLLEHEVLVALDGLGDDGLASTIALEADAIRDL